jgi:predicted ATP-grasp superfamily ATP-dependent carboligase
MAVSAARAGLRVFAADLFGDHDLRAVACEVATIRPYPQGLPAAIAPFPIAPWLYTGALENHPDLIANITERRPLAGSSAAAVTRVRDHGILAAATRAAGLLIPETRHRPTEIPADGSWLVKPRASAGGRGIRRWCGEEADASAASTLWQRHIAGRKLSVGYVLAAGTSQLVAASRQLVGSGWCRAGGFTYCGSLDLDPGALDAAVRDQLGRLGNLLASESGLIGLVGVDLVVDARQQMHVIEINPRPTASLEVAERATGFSMAAAHLDAFGIIVPRETDRWPRSGTWSKAILYAARDFVFDTDTLHAVLAHAASWTAAEQWPAVADIPEPPCPIPEGSPVCTVFAHGPCPREAITLLRHRVAAIEATILG